MTQSLRRGERDTVIHAASVLPSAVVLAGPTSRLRPQRQADREGEKEQRRRSFPEFTQDVLRARVMNSVMECRDESRKSVRVPSVCPFLRYHSAVWKLVFLSSAAETSFLQPPHIFFPFLSLSCLVSIHVGTSCLYLEQCLAFLLSTTLTVSLSLSLMAVFHP